MTKTVTLFLVAALALLILLAVGVKLIYFPAVKDTYFAMSQAGLLRVPSGIAVIRPTHFGKSVPKVIFASTQRKGDNSWRVSGRNVPLRDIVATAWGETPGRVQMPADAPTNNFDFLVTTGNPQPRLQKAIRSTFSYTADRETNDADVLALKVENPNLPGMTVSGPDEKENSELKHGKLYVTHLQLKELVSGFEQVLQTPVVDKTGLTNFYDFSLAFDAGLMMKLQNESTARPTVDKILAGWGLGLEPDTASIKMLVVKKVN